jgi:hypothetical protein
MAVTLVYMALGRITLPDPHPIFQSVWWLATQGAFTSTPTWQAGIAKLVSFPFPLGAHREEK